jgi:hypothetical protein
VIFTRIALVIGLVLVATMCWLAATGFTPVVPVLVTAIALLVLVGGGNMIRGRSSPYGGRRGQAPGGPEGSGSAGSP